MKRLKKTENKLEGLSIRMSAGLKNEMARMSKRRDRTLSEQIDHMLALGQMLIHFCDGRDNLKAVQEHLDVMRVGGVRRVPRRRLAD